MLVIKAKIYGVPKINPAVSLLIKHLVVGQRQKALNLSTFHWSTHGLLVSIGQHFFTTWGWSGCAMALGKLPGPGRPTIWMTVGQWITALAVGAGGFVWTFLLSSIFSHLFLPLSWRRPGKDWNTVSKGR